jgi:hypothetical protein
MKLDYDLSDLATAQADLWLFLRVEDIRAQILAEQAKHQASTQSWPRHHEENDSGCLHIRLIRFARENWEALDGLLSGQLSPWALPDSWSSTTLCVRAALRRVH